MRSFVALAGILLATGCPPSGRPPSDDAALKALLDSEESLAHEGRAAKGGAVTPLEQALRGYLWLREDRTVPAITDLFGVNARDLDRFERRVLYLVRGSSYYCQGWFTLAEKEFREADLITLKVEEVAVEGANTEPILMTDLLARAGMVLATSDEGLATADLGRLEEAASLVGDQVVVSYVRAEMARRRGHQEDLRDSLERLVKAASGSDKASIEKALAELGEGKEPSLDFLVRPGFLLAMGQRLLGPVLLGTRAQAGGAEALGKARESMEKLKRPPPPEPGKK